MWIRNSNQNMFTIKNEFYEQDYSILNVDEHDMLIALMIMYSMNFRSKTRCYIKYHDLNVLLKKNMDNETIYNIVDTLITKLSLIKYQKKDGEKIPFDVFSDVKKKKTYMILKYNKDFATLFFFNFKDKKWLAENKPISISIDIYFELSNIISKTIYRRMCSFTKAGTYRVTWFEIKMRFDLLHKLEEFEKHNIFRKMVSELEDVLPDFEMVLKDGLYIFRWNKKYNIRNTKDWSSIMEKEYKKYKKENVNINNAAETYNQEDDDIEEYDDDYLYNEPYFSEGLDYDREYY